MFSQNSLTFQGILFLILLISKVNFLKKRTQLKIDVSPPANIMSLLVGYLIFVGALVFEFVAPPPLDQILTTSEQLCKVP